MVKAVRKKKTTRKVRRARKVKQVKPGKPAKRKRKAKEEKAKFEGIVRPKLRVIGIGGGGCSIVAEIAPKVGQADFVAANTDKQALEVIRGPVRLFQFGQDVTSGLGTGMNPRLAEEAARKEKARIKEMLEGTDLCILVSCLGGGTGSGAAPIFAEIAQASSALCLGIFTLPFEFEGQKRIEIAKTSLEKIRGHLNALAIVPNERIFQIIDKTTSLEKAFSFINGILADALAGLIETIYRPSLINIDFADLKMVMEGRGRLAFLNCSLSQGKERSAESARKVLKNPLQAYGISGAERILFNISGGRDLKMSEVEHISKEISGLSKRAKVIFGISQVPGLGEKIKITVLAIGCGRSSRKQESKKTPKETSPGSIGQAKKQVPVEAEKVKEAPSRNVSRSEAAGPAKQAEEDKSSSVKSLEGKKEPEKPAKVMPEVRPRRVRLKRNALEVKKAVEEVEQEILRKEEAWESPAFLRRKEK